MDKIIKHGLQITAGLDPSSQKEMRATLRSIFTDEAHIDFNNPENIKGLKSFASLFKNMFEQVGNKKFDFNKMIELPGPEMFKSLTSAAKEFEGVWSSIASQLGNGGLKNVFMRDQSELDMALTRMEKGFKGKVSKIEDAFKPNKSKDINRLLESASGLKQDYNFAKHWEEQSMYLLKFYNIYQQVTGLINSGVDTSKIRQDLMSVYNELGSIGEYTIEQIESVLPQITTSFQNLLNLKNGKPFIGLTDGGAININVAPKLIKTLDVGDLTGGKKTIEVPVDAVFKGNLDKLRDFYAKSETDQDAYDEFVKLQQKMVEGLPLDVQEKAMDRLLNFADKFSEVSNVTNRSYNAIWKDFVGYGFSVEMGAGGESTNTNLEDQLKTLQQIQEYRELIGKYGDPDFGFEPIPVGDKDFEERINKATTALKDFEAQYSSVILTFKNGQQQQVYVDDLKNTLPEILKNMGNLQSIDFAPKSMDSLVNEYKILNTLVDEVLSKHSDIATLDKAGGKFDYTLSRNTVPSLKGALDRIQQLDPEFKYGNKELFDKATAILGQIEIAAERWQKVNAYDENYFDKYKDYSDLDPNSADRKKIKEAIYRGEYDNTTPPEDLSKQNQLVQQYNTNKEKTLALLKKEQLSYDEILYLVKEVQAEYSKAFYSDKNWDLGDDAFGLMTSVYNKLRRGDMIDPRLDKAINGVGMSAEDGARILSDYHNKQLEIIETQEKLNVIEGQNPQTSDDIKQEALSYDELRQKVEAYYKIKQQMISLMDKGEDFSHLMPAWREAEQDITKYLPKSGEDPMHTADGIAMMLQASDADQGSTLKHIANVLGIEIPQAAGQAEGAINGVVGAQERLRSLTAEEAYDIIRVLRSMQEMASENILWSDRQEIHPFGNFASETDEIKEYAKQLNLTQAEAEELYQEVQAYNQAVREIENAKRSGYMSNGRPIEEIYNSEYPGEYLPSEIDNPHFTDTIDTIIAKMEQLNYVESQNPHAQDDTGIHNANVGAINAENDALQQQKKIINDVVAAKEGLKASQTQLGVIGDKKNIFGESTLDVVKTKQKELKTYLQELTKIEAQEKKNGALTEAEVARKQELVKLVQEMSFAVRYKDGSYYETRGFGDDDSDLSQQIEQLNQIVSLKKQIALGYYNTGDYGTYADTFNGESIRELINGGSASFGYDIDQFNSEMIGQLAREYQELHRQMLRCMLVGEEVPQGTLDKMKWFESLDATQLETLLPKLNELQGKIVALQSKDGLTDVTYGKDDVYYDNKIQDLNTLLELQKEYFALGGPPEGKDWDTSLRYTTEGLQEIINQFNIAKQGAQDVLKIKNAFSGIDLKGFSGIESIVRDVSWGLTNYDQALSKITQKLELSKESMNQLKTLDSNSEDIKTLEDNLAKRKEIHNTLRNEGLLNEQIEAQYNDINQKILEKINLLQKAQSTGTGIDKTTPAQTIHDGVTTGEVEELEKVRSKVEEISNAVNRKNKEFYNEAQVVSQAVGKENAALISLKGNVEAITNAINIKTQAFLTEQSVVRRVAQSEANALNTVRTSATSVRTELGNINTILSNINTRPVSIQMPNLGGVTSQGNIANETLELERLREKLGEVTLAVKAKTASFVQEETMVRQSVAKEISTLTQLERIVTNINTNIGNLIQGIQTGVNNLGNFNGINLNVNSTVNLTTIENTLTNILTTVRNINTGARNNNAGGGGAGGGGRGGNQGPRAVPQHQIDKLESDLEKYRSSLDAAGNLTQAYNNEIDRLLVELGNLRIPRDVTRWQNEFSQFKNIVGIYDNEEKRAVNRMQQTTQRDIIGDYQEIGKLLAKRENATSQEEVDSINRQIKAWAALAQEKQRNVDVDKDVRRNAVETARREALTTYAVEAEEKAYKNAEAERQKTLRAQVKESRNQAGVSKSTSVANKAVETLIEASGIEGISQDQLNNLDIYRGKIETLRSTIANFPKNGVASEIQQNQLINQRMEVERYTQEIQELIAQNERLSKPNAINTGINMSAALGIGSDNIEAELTKQIQALTKGRVSIKGYNAETQQLIYTQKAAGGGTTQFTAEINRLNGQLTIVQGTTTKAMGVFDTIIAKTKQFSYYFTGSMMIYRVIGWIREGVTAVKELDSAMTELKKVTDETEETYDKFLDTASEIGNRVGSTMKDVVSSTADWSRLGYSLKEATQFAEATQVLMNVSEFTDVSKATDSLISSIQAFKYTAEESMGVVDILNEIGK